LKILTSKEKDVLQNLQTQPVESAKENKTPVPQTVTIKQENLKSQIEQKIEQNVAETK